MLSNVLREIILNSRYNPDSWCRLPINHRLLSLFGSEQSRAINFSQFISSYPSFHFLATEARPLFCHAPLLSTWSSRCGSCELQTWPRKIGPIVISQSQRRYCDHKPMRGPDTWPQEVSGARTEVEDVSKAWKCGTRLWTLRHTRVIRVNTNSIKI